MTDDQRFGGLTKAQWAELENQAGYLNDTNSAGLIFWVPIDFARERLVPLGREALLVGVAICDFAFRRDGRRIHCGDVRGLACQLSEGRPIDYPAVLRLLEEKGLITWDGDYVFPLFYVAAAHSLEPWYRRGEALPLLTYETLRSFLSTKHVAEPDDNSSSTLLANRQSDGNCAAGTQRGIPRP